MLKFDAKTSPKGRFTVPAEIRRALGLAPGGLLQFTVDDNGRVSVATVPQKPDDVSGNDKTSHNKETNNNSGA